MLMPWGQPGGVLGAGGLFHLVFEGNFQVQAPGGLIVGGAI